MRDNKFLRSIEAAEAHRVCTMALWRQPETASPPRGFTTRGFTTRGFTTRGFTTRGFTTRARALWKQAVAASLEWLPQPAAQISDCPIPVYVVDRRSPTRFDRR